MCKIVLRPGAKHIFHAKILQGILNQKIQMLSGLKWDLFKKCDKWTNWAGLAILQAMNSDQMLSAGIFANHSEY